MSYLTNITVLNDIILNYVNELTINEKYNKVLNELINLKRKVEYDNNECDNECSINCNCNNDLNIYYELEKGELYIEINYSKKKIDLDYICPGNRYCYWSRLNKISYTINDKIKEKLKEVNDNFIENNKNEELEEV
jgi:hypothetical protein